MTDGVNRLGRSRSPYLLQHADQPVWWWEWCDEAFQHARTLDRPLFLSIGYSTCHWCHVMARESFDDPEVAAVLNRSFVSIKLDREERPDLDEHFMAVCQFQTGSGGWPLSIFLTPDGVPFYAATYLPRHAQRGMPGIVEVLERIAVAWREQRSLVLRNASLLAGGVARHFEPEPGEFSRQDLFISAWESLQRMLDTEWGGFALAPKFPSPVRLRFLMRVFRRLDDPLALNGLTTTLERMMQGGIRDQIGGGYHRYTVDREWKIPHFEKMLYDQALLLQVFCEAYLLTGRGDFLDEAASIVRYVTRDLASDEGVFYAAEDADSEGEEGRFYLWGRGEILEALGVTNGTVVADALGIPPSGSIHERSVPRRVPQGDVARRHGMTPHELATRLPEWLESLRIVRERRPRPFRDRKVITEWNGLMIASLAGYAAITGDETAWSGAVRAFDWFVGRELQEGSLARTWYEGERGGAPLLNDHAALMAAAIELHQAGFGSRYLHDAIRRADEVERTCLSPSAASVQGTPGGIPVPYDSVIPPPAALLAESFGRLARLTGEERYRRIGDSLFHRFGGTVFGRPVSFISLLLAGDYYDDHAPTITLPVTSPVLPATLHEFRRVSFLPGAVWKGGEGERGELCSARMCHGSFSTPAELGALLKQFSFVDSRTDAA